MRKVETLTVEQMLLALLDSENESCRETAKEILSHRKTIAEVSRYCGSFLSCVLRDDYEGAIDRADSENRRALKNYINNLNKKLL